MGDDAQVAPGPVDCAGLRLETAVVVEKRLNEIHATQPCCNPEILNGGTTFQEQAYHAATVPIQGFFKRRPATGPVDGGAGVEQQFGNFDVVATGARTERSI